MFWSHSLVAVGEEENNATLTNPLVLARADELVNDTLQTVIVIESVRFHMYSAYMDAYNLLVLHWSSVMGDNKQFG